MNNLAKMIADGKITVEELASAGKLIERAKLVLEGINACKKTLVFPLGTSEIHCYDFTDSSGEYSAWGTCDSSGIFKCYCNWGGDHLIGECDLNSFSSVFMAFENGDMDHNLRHFLKQQIEKAKK